MAEHLDRWREPPGIVRHVKFATEPNSQPFADLAPKGSPRAKQASATWDSLVERGTEQAHVIAACFYDG